MTDAASLASVTIRLEDIMMLNDLLHGRYDDELAAWVKRTDHGLNNGRPKDKRNDAPGQTMTYSDMAAIGPGFLCWVIRG